MPRQKSLAARFWSHILYTDDPHVCWIWTGAVNAQTGQGQFQRHTRPVRFQSAPRLAYELTHNRPIPREMNIRHLCKNTLCCNPRHMQIGPQLLRFYQFLDQSSGPYGCWLWQGKMRHGYGILHITLSGKRSITSAHRLAFALSGGKISKGQLILHRCDVRNCCNPLHLCVGTHQDNSDDKVAKGRHKKFEGTAHGMAKLTDADVLEIRQARGIISPTILAERFGVSYANIWRIQAGVSWKHLPMPETSTAQQRHMNAKLSVEQVMNIRTMHASGRYSYTTLSKLFRVDRATLWNIVHRKTWKHLPEQGTPLQLQLFP